MQTHPAKRVEITIEAPMQRRITRLLIDAGINGFSILPVLGGSGRSGHWTREGQVSSAGGMISIVCIIRAERLDTLLETVFPMVDSHIGVVSVTDCQVMRAERF